MSFRALFSTELRRALPRSTLILAGLTGLTILLLRSMRRFGLDLSSGADVLLTSATLLLPACAYLLGVFAFPAEAKRQDFAVWFALPIGRGRVWAAVVLAHGLAMLIAASLAFALLLWAFDPGELSPPMLALLAGGCCLLYSGGVCMALLFRGQTHPLTTGLLLTATILVETLGPALEPFGNGQESAMIHYLTVAESMLLLGWLSLSFVWLRDGDLYSARRRLRHWAQFAGLVFVLGLSLRSAPLLERFLHLSVEFLPSPDGRFVLVERYPNGWSPHYLRLLDTRTGRATSPFVALDSKANWSADGRVLAVARRVHPELVLLRILDSGRDFEVLRLAPDGAVLERIQPEGGLRAAQPLSDGRMLLLEDRPAGPRASILDIGTGARRDLDLKLPTHPDRAVWWPWSWSVQGRAVIEDALARKAWLVDGSKAVELREVDPPSWTTDRINLVFNGELYHRPDSAAAAIEKEYPASTPGRVIVPEKGILTAVAPVFRVAAGNLLEVHSPKHPDWAPIGQLTPSREVFTFKKSLTDFDFRINFRAFLGEGGLVAYESGGRALLYDALLDRTSDLGPMQDDSRLWFSLPRGMTAPIISVGTRPFVYRRESGLVQELHAPDVHPAWWWIHADLERQRFLLQDPPGSLAVLEEGRRQILWP